MKGRQMTREELDRQTAYWEWCRERDKHDDFWIDMSGTDDPEFCEWWRDEAPNRKPVMIGRI